MTNIESVELKANLRSFRESLDRLPQTNWWVVTGGPSTGKTTLLDYLARNGYNTRPEAARVLIDQELAKGRSIEAIRANEEDFQNDVLNMKYEIDEKTDPSISIIWDRGTGGDSIAYYPDEVAIGASDSIRSWDRHHRSPQMVEIRNKYKGIFILDRLPDYEVDYARIEDDSQADKIHGKIKDEYKLLGYEPIRVPVFSSNPLVSVQMRARFIVDHMRSVDPSVPDFEIDPREPRQPELPIKI